jgi:aldose 1-epimerase
MTSEQTSGAVEIWDASGTCARILTGYGFNCVSFSVATPDGPVETLWAEPGFGPGKSPLFSGIPVLFPFGGRLVGNTFRWQGTEYTVTDALTYHGNILHGFVIDRPWRILEQSENRVVGEFHAAVDEPALLSQYPADFRIRMSYEIGASSLRSEITVDNPGGSPLPWGFTTHGYYRLSLGGGTPEESIVRIPAGAAWVLDDDVLPTGEIAPVSGENDYRLDRPLGGRAMDAIFTRVEPEADGSLVASITDPGAGRTLRIISRGPFREFVVYTAEHREAVAIEPYTCAPTTFDLTARGFDAGLRVLEPGQSEQMTITVQLDEGE